MRLINCEHPVEAIRVIWRIERRNVPIKHTAIPENKAVPSDKYRVELAHANCGQCMSNLPDTEPNAKVAINLIMAELARRNKHAAEDSDVSIKGVTN